MHGCDFALHRKAAFEIRAGFSKVLLVALDCCGLSLSNGNTLESKKRWMAREQTVL